MKYLIVVMLFAVSLSANDKMCLRVLGNGSYERILCKDLKKNLDVGKKLKIIKVTPTGEIIDVKDN